MPKNNKATIGLRLGIISLLSWVTGAIVGRLTNDYRLITLSIFTFGILAIIGIIFAVIGFKSHKILSVIAIVFCILGILPSFIILNLMSSIGMPVSDLVPNQVYKEADFSIEIPHGWIKLKSNSAAKDAGIRVAFVPKQNNESYKPRISVTSLEIEEAKNLDTFARREEAAIKSEYNFIAGKTFTLLEGTFYQIEYTRNEKGQTIKGKEILTVKNGVGYIITTESLESSYTKYLHDFTKTFLSFKIF